MSRYYVVLNGTHETAPYIIAEVVREPSDNGRYRDISLAGNLAGSGASILTEDELRAHDGGRAALVRWRAGDDTPFILDTLAHDTGLAETQFPADRPLLSIEGAQSLIEGTARRTQETLKEAQAIRRRSLSSRKKLQKTLEETRAQRSKSADLLADLASQLGTERPRPKRRHLRSVS